MSEKILTFGTYAIRAACLSLLIYYYTQSVILILNISNIILHDWINATNTVQFKVKVNSQGQLNVHVNETGCIRIHM